ncbi:MAG: hypothetical protein Q9163_006171, partial [Psora crenata]
MKAAIISGVLAALAPTIWASPVEKRQDYTKINYPPGTGENLPSYPPGTGENLPSYPPGTGENLPSYPPGTGENSKQVFNFTSTYQIVATPDQVVNGTTNATPTGGLEGCTGYYNFGINADLDLICYSIKLEGFRGEFVSPARTATHIHEAARGMGGPPRLVFPNPVGDEKVRYSFGCMQ